MVRNLGVRVAVVAAVIGIPAVAHADNDTYPYPGSIPDRTGAEFNELFTESLEVLPGLREVSSSRLYIFGTNRDDLIYEVQFTRGYQLRPEANPGRLVGSGTRAMQPELARAWAGLRAEAGRQGWSLSVTSAFRSVDVQRSIARRRYRYADTWSEVNAVARWHSVPGTSKHHTGYTLDIGYAGRKLQSHDAPYRWLAADNYAVAKSFGFIPSYPPDGGKQGPNPEPWEWNWVGIDQLICGARDAGQRTWDGTFCDDDGSTFEDDIEAIAAAGITRGCNPPTNDRFCPHDFVTRGQMAALLVRAFGYTDTGEGDVFVDDDASTFEGDIDKLAAAGVTKGCNPPTNDRFCPDHPVSRAQAAALLVRALGYEDAGRGDLFVDDDGSTFEREIDLLGAAGVTKGCNPPANDRYCPEDFVTRGQMAAFLNRAFDEHPRPSMEESK